MTQLDLRITSRHPYEPTDMFPFMGLVEHHFVKFDGEEFFVSGNRCVYWQHENQPTPHPEAVIDDILQWMWEDNAL